MRSEGAFFFLELLRMVPVAALFSYGYTLVVQTVHQLRFKSISSGYAQNTIGAWLRAATESVSRESFWHSLFSATLVRDIPASLVYTTAAFRSLLSAAGLLFFSLVIRTVPPHPVYAILGASFLFRIIHHDHRQLHSTLFFGAALFLLPLLHPQFFDIFSRMPAVGGDSGISMVYAIASGVLFFLAGRKQISTTALLALLLILEHTGRIPPAAVPVLSLTIFAGSNAALHAWIRKTAKGADSISRVLVLETAVLSAGTLLAGFLHPGGGLRTAAAVLCMTAITEFLILHAAQRKKTVPRTVLADPLSVIEADEYQICTKSEYALTLVQLILGTASDTFSRLQLLLRDLQNAGTLIHKTRSIRTGITREEAVISTVARRVEKAGHIIRNHQQDHDMERRLDTILHISRYTGRITGKIVNLAEYFDRLRKKNAFFSDEESMEVTELLAIISDITGYVSDYLAGMVHDMDPAVLSGMEGQLLIDSEVFRKEALARLERSHTGSVRTNLTFIETIETIGSILHYLDRTSSLAGKIDQHLM